MLISEMSFSCLKWQMDRTLRAVVQAGIADLTVIREFHTVTRKCNVIGRTDFHTDPTANAALIHCIIKCHILIYDLRCMILMVVRHLFFKL